MRGISRNFYFPFLIAIFFCINTVTSSPLVNTPKPKLFSWNRLKSTFQKKPSDPARSTTQTPLHSGTSRNQMQQSIVNDAPRPPSYSPSSVQPPSYQESLLTPPPTYYAHRNSFTSNGRIADTLGDWYRVNNINKLQPPDRLELYESYSKFLKKFNLEKLSPSDGSKFLSNIRESNDILKLKKPQIEPLLNQVSWKIGLLDKELAKMQKSKTYDESKYRETKKYADELKEWQRSYQRIPEYASFKGHGDVTTTLKDWYSVEKLKDLKPEDRQQLIAQYKRYLRGVKIPNPDETQSIHEYTSSWAPRVMKNIVNSARTLKLSKLDVEPVIKQISARIEANQRIMARIKGAEMRRGDSLTDSQKTSMKATFDNIEYLNNLFLNRREELLQIK
ncbi:hypothetical protein ROZALSC1DRAFT_25048 [Rozella allomycis CSF55]|uniref:Uncharacterized protein n=1 Tax=Rozella allomycis (strain CSF55) TaxID=988480 RepID=A0A4V1IZ30_ROZAC|nr:hypothetical protein ROZALSC1DRAFT_25048 [Rozella allomycis CSF55]